MLLRLLNGLKDLIYPQTCLACKKIFRSDNKDELVCGSCREKVILNIPPFCVCCGRHLEAKNAHKNICPRCLRSKLHFDRAFSPCVYEGVIKELIHEFKYKGKDYLGKPLSRLLIDFIQAYELPTKYMDCIIPIPLHKLRLREREFNQSEILAQYLAGEFKLDMPEGALLRCRNTKQQAELDLDQRAINVKDSFRVPRQELVAGKNIILVDDVLTTGATLSEAALALKNSGANIVFVLTLAN